MKILRSKLNMINYSEPKKIIINTSIGIILYGGYSGMFDGIINCIEQEKNNNLCIDMINVSVNSIKYVTIIATFPISFPIVYWKVNEEKKIEYNIK